MKDLKTVEELVDKMIINTVVDKLSLEDVHELVKAAQKDAIEVAMSRAEEEFKVVEIQEVTDRANYMDGVKLVHKIDHMSVFECKEKLIISLL